LYVVKCRSARTDFCLWWRYYGILFCHFDIKRSILRSCKRKFN
jgi:hypothetical protein